MFGTCIAYQIEFAYDERYKTLFFASAGDFPNYGEYIGAVKEFLVENGDAQADDPIDVTIKSVTRRGTLYTKRGILYWSEDM